MVDTIGSISSSISVTPFGAPRLTFCVDFLIICHILADWFLDAIIRFDLCFFVRRVCQLERYAVRLAMEIVCRKLDIFFGYARVLTLLK